jgi:hypothetical protein
MQGVRNIETEEVFLEVIRLMQPGIVKNLVVDNVLLNELVKGRCISEETKGKIQCICEGVSRNAGKMGPLNYEIGI